MASAVSSNDVPRIVRYFLLRCLYSYADTCLESNPGLYIHFGLVFLIIFGRSDQLLVLLVCYL